MAGLMARGSSTLARPAFRMRFIDRLTGHRLHGMSDERLLELVVAGRATRHGSQWDIAKEAWRLLAARSHDRVRGLVVAFRFPGHADVEIASDDYDEAAQECFIRATKMLGNFRGTTIAEFRAAQRTCVTNTCMDFCRRRLARERGIAGSIDEPDLTQTEFGRFDEALASIASRQQAVGAAVRDDLAEVAVGIERLENAQMREVLRRRMCGETSQEIAKELGLTSANVDQLFSRGTRRLREVMDDA